MRVSAVFRLSATAVRRATKKKSDHILVDCKSFVTDFNVQRIRPRLDDKLEFLCWDPLVQRTVLFKETKKIRSIPPLRDRPSEPRFQDLELLKVEGEEQQTYKWYRLADFEGRGKKTEEDRKWIKQGEKYPPYQ